MKVLLQQVIVNVDGEPVVAENGEPLTVAWACVNALLVIPSNSSISGQEKYGRGKLAERIAEATGPVEMSAKEIVQVKECIGEVYGPLVVMRVWDSLESGETGGKS